MVDSLVENYREDEHKKIYRSLANRGWISLQKKDDSFKMLPTLSRERTSGSAAPPYLRTEMSIGLL